MKKIIYILIFLLTVSLVTAMDRNIPSTATSSFTLTYDANDAPAGNWGVLIEDDISGPCTFSDGSKHVATGWMSPQTQMSLTILTTGTGTCTFIGNYQYADANGALPLTNFPTGSVTVTSSCTPDCSCASSTCQGSTCSDGCGGTCQGTMDCGCVESWSCSSWTTCNSGTQTRTCTDSNNCGTTNNKPSTSRTCTLQAYCGDGTCDADETCSTCEQDCGKCTEPPIEGECLPYVQDEIEGKCEFNNTAKTLLYILIFLFFIQFLK